MGALGMKWMILIAVLVAATEVQAQDAAGTNSSKQPMSEKVITTKDDGQNNGSAARVHQGVRPAPAPAPKLAPAEGEKKRRGTD
jgi:hypothetical protein